MRLSAQADYLQVPVRMALTATAAQPVRDEIVRRLGLRKPEIVVGDFDRPHIALSARRLQTVEDKQRELAAAASEFEGPGSSTPPRMPPPRRRRTRSRVIRSRSTTPGSRRRSAGRR